MMARHGDPNQPKPTPKRQTQDEAPPAISKPGSGTRGKRAKDDKDGAENEGGAK